MRMNKALKEMLRAFYHLNKFREECKEAGSFVYARQSLSNVEWELFYAIRELTGKKKLTMPDVLELSKKDEVWKGK